MADVSATRRGTRRAFPPGCVFWVVFAGERELALPLTLVSRDSRETLAIFSHEEEAEMFLCLCGATAHGWRARETSAEDVISLLYGPCCGAKAVALDPLPGILDNGFLGLLTLDRSSFVGWLVSRDAALPDAG